MDRITITDTTTGETVASVCPRTGRDAAAALQAAREPAIRARLRAQGREVSSIKVVVADDGRYLVRHGKDEYRLKIATKWFVPQVRVAIEGRERPTDINRAILPIEAKD